MRRPVHFDSELSDLFSQMPPKSFEFIKTIRDRHIENGRGDSIQAYHIVGECLFSLVSPTRVLEDGENNTNLAQYQQIALQILLHDSVIGPALNSILSQIRNTPYDDWQENLLEVLQLIISAAPDQLEWVLQRVCHENLVDSDIRVLDAVLGNGGEVGVRPISPPLHRRLLKIALLADADHQHINLLLNHHGLDGGLTLSDLSSTLKSAVFEWSDYTERSGITFYNTTVLTILASTYTSMPNTLSQNLPDDVVGGVLLLCGIGMQLTSTIMTLATRSNSTNINRNHNVILRNPGISQRPEIQLSINDSDEGKAEGADVSETNLDVRSEHSLLIKK